MKVRVLFSTLLVIVLLGSILAPLSAAQGRTDTGAAPSLDDLEGMYQKGLITKEEYVQALEGLGQPEGVGPEALWPGPDGFGYYGQVIPFNWVDITATGTLIAGLTDDNYLTGFPIGFTFPFYGGSYTTFDLANNGFFGFGLTSGSLSNQCPLPSATTPNNVIALLWDDLYPNYTTGGVYYQTFDPCPVGVGVCLVVEYYNWNHYGGAAGSAGTWEAILYDNGEVILQYLDVGVEEGSSSTTGMENNDAAADFGLTYACNTAASLVDNLAIYIVLPPPAPRFDDSEKMAPAKIEAGEIMTYTVVIVNSGDAPGLATVMTDVIPAGTEFISGSLTCDSGTCWYDDAANAVYWEGEVLPPARAELEGWQPEAPVAPEGDYDPAAVADLVGGVEPAAPPAPGGTSSTWTYPEAILWDNGPLVTVPGDCAGMDASRLQTGLGMNTLGFGHQFVNGYRMADDFAIADPGGWNIDQITFFAYQTSAPVDPSPITGVYYQIWDGPPDDPGSSVVFGDLITNRLLSTGGSNMQRDSENTPCANNRYIFADVASAGLWLPPGTYWLDWMTDGSPSYSGPWAPPITIVGQTTTGNALQYTGAWAAANDTGTGTQQGMPFVIEGTIVSPNEVTVEFAVETPGVYCGDTIVNEAVIYDPEAAGPVVVAAETLVVAGMYYMEDFEADDGGYTSVGVDPWTWGPPPMGPAHSGANAWSTESPYVPGADYQLLSAPIDLTTAPPDLVLQWWQDIFIESASWDHAYVEITTDTVTYEILWQHTGGTYDSDGWEHRMADISGYAGEVVQLRFRMDSDGSVQYDGWAIDDVAIHVDCAGPIIDVDPDALENVQYPDQVISQTLDISNLGDNLLLWNFFETPALLGPEALSFYYDRGVFDGDWPGLPVEGFENTLVPDFSVLACDGPFNSATNNACFAPGGILDGISLMNVTPGNQMVVLGDGLLGPHTAIVGPNTFVDHQDIFFDPPVPAVGFDVVEPFAPGDALDIYVYGPGDVLLGQDTFTVGAFPPSFWGVASAPDLITRIRTESPAGNGELFDDIAFGGMLFECGVDWATPSPDAGMNMPGDTVPVEVGFDSTGLAVGVYTGTLCIESNDPAAPLVPVPVTMTVEPPPVIVVEPTEFSVELCADGTEVLTFTICNTGLGDLDWDVTEPVDIPWLSQDPISGTVLPDECQVVDLTFDATGLAAGDYDGSLVLVSNDPDTPTTTLPVSLTVLAPAAIVDVTPDITDLTVAFDAEVEGTLPITYVWDFGDGFGDVGEDVIHTYSAGGCYTVTLEVTNECGTDVWSDEVCVEEPFYYYYLPMLYKNG